MSSSSKKSKVVDEPYLKFEYNNNCSSISTRHRHIHNVTSMKYVQSMDQISVFAERSGAVKIYDADSAKIVSSFTLPRGAPMAAEYVKCKDSMMMSFGDTTMCLYDWKTYKTAIAEDGTPLMWPSNRVQYSLKWLEKHKRLYSGSVDGVVESWDIDRRKILSEMKGHSDVVADIYHLRGVDTIATASLDKTICIWDLYTSTCEQVLKGHQLGVVSLTYVPEQRMLLSAGFDHDVIVWSPFSKKAISKLKGHNASVVKVCFLISLSLSLSYLLCSSLISRTHSPTHFTHPFTTKIGVSIGARHK